MIDLLAKEYATQKRKKLFPLTVLVGTGGTGSALVQQIAQMYQEFDDKGFLLLADPDTIEEKNIKNQLFTPGTVGKKKAEVLAKRYSSAYGVNIHSYTKDYVESVNVLQKLYNPEYINIPNFSSIDMMVLPILIGCVDNNWTRKIFHDFFNKVPTLLYLDAGNESTKIPVDFPTRPKSEWTSQELIDYNESGWTGQVVAGLKINGKTILDPAAVRYPDILEDDPTDKQPSKLSCEELSASDPQRLVTNRMAALSLSSYVAELFDCGTISNSLTVFHSRKGYMRSEMIPE
ncbi:ThiF family adenylyltransferase [Rossellomorea marisflavi]|uniref:ThiF family adenylyltransferase n=1 Tax=Rossellomorea marisflavi TaxID=189381 RepID=UPI00201D763E|nr:ThiF family adenylyltransferase [Rossellomorea marisflavi]